MMFVQSQLKRRRTATNALETTSAAGAAITKEDDVVKVVELAASSNVSTKGSSAIMTLVKTMTPFTASMT